MTLDVGARGRESRAGRELRMGACLCVVLPPHRAGAVLAVLARTRCVMGVLRLHPRRLAGAGGGALDPQPVRDAEPAAARAAALRLLHVLLRAFDAGGLLVPAAAPRVDGTQRRRRLEPRLPLDRQPT